MGGQIVLPKHNRSIPGIKTIVISKTVGAKWNQIIHHRIINQIVFYMICGFQRLT